MAELEQMQEQEYRVPQDEAEWVTLRKAFLLIGGTISFNRLASAVQAGRIESRLMGNSRLVTVEGVRAYLAEHPEKDPEAVPGKNPKYVSRSEQDKGSYTYVGGDSGRSISSKRDREYGLRGQGQALVRDLRRAGYQVKVKPNSNGAGLKVLPTARHIEGYIAFSVR